MQSGTRRNCLAVPSRGKTLIAAVESYSCGGVASCPTATEDSVWMMPLRVFEETTQTVGLADDKRPMNWSAKSFGRRGQSIT